MVKIENCSRDQYDEMLQRVLEEAVFGLLNQNYDAKNRIGYLYFWDSDYIPQEWSIYVVRPAGNPQANGQRISEEYQSKLKRNS